MKPEETIKSEAIIIKLPTEAQWLSVSKAITLCSMYCADLIKKNTGLFY